MTKSITSDSGSTLSQEDIYKAFDAMHASGNAPVKLLTPRDIRRTKLTHFWGIPLYTDPAVPKDKIWVEYQDGHREVLNAYSTKEVSEEVMTNINTLEEILLHLYRPHPNLQPEDYLFVNDPKFQKAKQALNLYIEGKMKEARLDELKHIDDPANVRLWFDGFYGVEERIKELEG